MANGNRGSITRLIAIPAVITLLITFLRLEGELNHWGAPWFNNAPGGGGAIVGISWLPFIFGPWFALDLLKAGNGFEKAKRAWGYLGLGFVVLIASGIVLGVGISKQMKALAIVGFAGMLVAAFLPRIGWRALARTLIAYAFAARIPVLIVMFFAMQGNGGAGWGTHYDAVPPGMAHLPFSLKFLFEAFLPQMTLWIAWTVIAGMLAGMIAVALARRGRSEAAVPAKA
ncbi:MAG: hypothetical protein EPN47_08460 [Acidobacteria bacterium]|nr:MAG: hypothetical protein EPN47_08460 [Acidobacteriota bacterium]